MPSIASAYRGPLVIIGLGGGFSVVGAVPVAITFSIGVRTSATIIGMGFVGFGFLLILPGLFWCVMVRTHSFKAWRRRGGSGGGGAGRRGRGERSEEETPALARQSSKPVKSDQGSSSSRVRRWPPTYVESPPPHVYTHPFAADPGCHDDDGESRGGAWGGGGRGAICIYDNDVDDDVTARGVTSALVAPPVTVFTPPTPIPSPVPTPSSAQTAVELCKGGEVRGEGLLSEGGAVGEEIRLSEVVEMMDLSYEGGAVRGEGLRPEGGQFPNSNFDLCTSDNLVLEENADPIPDLDPSTISGQTATSAEIGACGQVTKLARPMRDCDIAEAPLLVTGCHVTQRPSILCADTDSQQSNAANHVSRDAETYNDVIEQDHDVKHADIGVMLPDNDVVCNGLDAASRSDEKTCRSSDVTICKTGTASNNVIDSSRYDVTDPLLHDVTDKSHHVACCVRSDKEEIKQDTGEGGGPGDGGDVREGGGANGEEDGRGVSDVGEGAPLVV